MGAGVDHILKLKNYDNLIRLIVLKQILIIEGVISFGIKPMKISGIILR